MSGITIAALVAAAASLAIYGGALAWKSPRREWRFLLVALALQLPMCALAFRGVRGPLDEWLGPWLRGTEVFGWIRLLYAPLTEEPAKLWPLLLPWFARRVTADNAVRVAVALGLGFGLGEIVLVAGFVQGNPKVASLPWYQLGGFINERFMVCIMHGAFTAVALCAWRRQWRGGLPLGIALAMLLHLLGNLPIRLSAIGWFGSNKAVAATVVGLWVAVFWLLMVVLLIRLGTGHLRLGQAIFGDAMCPGCGVAYPRPFFAVNLFHKRLERCPHCKRWHVTQGLRPGR